MLRHVLRILVGLGLACGFACAVQAASVVIVTSDASSGVQETAEVAATELSRLGVRSEEIVRERASNFGRTVAGRNDVRVYLTLGVEALREVLKANVREPVVAALVPRSALDRVLAELGRRSGSTLSALYLDQPLGRQLDLIRIALPDVKRVGLVLGPEAALQQAALTAALRSRGLEPVVGQVTSPDGLFAGLKPALEMADALLAVPDSMVFNSSTLASILTASYRARIPLVAFSPAYVKAGALLSVYSTPAQIGTQASAMVRSYYLGGSGLASQYPADFSVRVNDSVARSLGLTLREEQLNEQLRRLERRP